MAFGDRDIEEARALSKRVEELSEQLKTSLSTMNTSLTGDGNFQSFASNTGIGSSYNSIIGGKIMQSNDYGTAISGLSSAANAALNEQASYNAEQIKNTDQGTTQ
jgi:hypothetical protein